MKEVLSKKNSNVNPIEEENLLNWNEVLVKFKTAFGNDIYESWIRKIEFINEYNDYILISLSFY